MTNETAASQYRFDCADRDCSKTWRGDDLARIAKNVAWHWNKDHNDDLRHGPRKQIDEVERGGHHLHGNEYSVERIPIYLTAFDVMERLGKEDGYAVLSDAADVCVDCMEVLEDTSDAIPLDDDAPLRDEYRCRECHEEREIERKQSQNEQITEFAT